MAKFDIFDALKQLVAEPSVSSKSTKWDMTNKGVIDLLAEWLTDIGFLCDIQPVEGQPGKFNLIASKGSGPGGLVFSGHTDTVPYDEARWQTDPFKLTEKDNKWYGLGATDMKGFFPVAIEAARAFQEDNFQQPLIILATADEESSMSGARQLAKLGKPKARYAVIGEPTGLKPIRMHKGIMMEKIEITGLAGHSSNPDLGNNALDAMHIVISDLIEFRHELAQSYQHEGFTIPSTTLNLGCIHGGDNPNRICGQCELQFDLRAIPGMDNHELREKIRDRLKPIAEQQSIDIQLQPLFDDVPAFEQPLNSEFTKTLESLTGYDSESVSFATEAPFLQQLGLETLVMGPGSIDQAHQPDEFIPLDQVAPAVDILKSLIKRYCL